MTDTKTSHPEMHVHRHARVALVWSDEDGWKGPAVAGSFGEHSTDLSDAARRRSMATLQHGGAGAILTTPRVATGERRRSKDRASRPASSALGLDGEQRSGTGVSDLFASAIMSRHGEGSREQTPDTRSRSANKAQKTRASTLRTPKANNEDGSKTTNEAFAGGFNLELGAMLQVDPLAGGCKEEDEEEACEELKMHSGLVIDFVTRQQKGDIHDPHADLSRILGGKQSSLDYLTAAGMVNQEMLLSDMMSDITYFWKELDEPAWRYDVNIIKTRYTQVVRMKREVVCLRAEVSNWLLRYKLVHAEPERVETQGERHTRHQEFWAQLHEVPRKLEVRQSFKANKETLRALQESLEPRLPPVRLGSSQKSQKSDSTKDKKSLDIRHRSGNDLQWKARAGRSRCAAGTWDWAKGSTDVPNAMGQTAGCKFAQTSGMWAYDDAPEFASDDGLDAGMATTSVTFKNAGLVATEQYETQPHFRWWKSRLPDPLGAGPCVGGGEDPKARGMGKSASLPSLGSRRSAQSPNMAGMSKGAGNRQMRATASRAVAGSSQSLGFSPESRTAAVSPEKLRKEPASGARFPWQKKDLESGFSASLPALGSRAMGPSGMASTGSSWPRPPELSRAVSLPTLTSAPAVSMMSMAAMGCQEISKFEQAEIVNDLPSPATLSSFQVPWQGRCPIPALKCQDSPAKKYLLAAQSSKVVPRPQPFITGHSVNFTPCEASLSDEDLMCVVDMMAGLKVPLKEVILAEERLSEQALTAFITALSTPPASFALQHLGLRRCLNAGALACDVITKMLSDWSTGCMNLRFLDLSGIQIGLRRHAPLAKAISEHPTLTTLSMADTGIGGGNRPEQCVCDILSNVHLRKLDLGWNCFDENVFAAMGERLAEVGTLTSLQIANASSSGQVGRASPVAWFIEQLSRNYTLRKLDMSLNRIDFRAALVIEDALEKRSNLVELDVSHNPLGFCGMRNILRLLSLNSSGLTHFNCDDCTKGLSTNTSEIYQIFSATNPSKRYTLDLQRPYHRALLRMLYKLTERFQLAPDYAFSDIKYSLVAYTHATKDSHGVWVTPTQGILSVAFSLDPAMEREMKIIPDPFDFARVLERHLELTRVKPGFRKVIPLLAEWKSIDGQMQEQTVLLDAMSKDFLIPYPYIEEMATSRTALVQLVQKLLPIIEGGQLTRYLALSLIPSLADLTRVLKENKNFLEFNIDNPNGKYVLDLAKPSDHAVAEHMIILDHWESGITKRLKRADTSQNGNGSQFRNELYAHRIMNVASIQDWNMPEVDIFDFDYSTGKRPPSGAKELDADTYSNILVNLHCSDCSPVDQMHALQRVSHHIYVTCTQMRGFLGLYKDEEVRLTLCVLFYARVVDLHNEKVFRVRFESEHELLALRDRLGWVSTFPYIQPEQSTFKFNYAYYEQREAANILLMLGGHESPANIKNFTYTHASGWVDPLPTGIPKSWEVFESMPQSGVLVVGDYMCSPEDRNFQYRKQIYEHYGYRKTSVPEDKVMWWADLNDAPQDVLDLLQWIDGHFPGDKGVTKCFQAIDGPGGNGVVSLREFEEGLALLHCKAYHGKDEMHRIHGVFRYLDPGGEGTISLGEWGVLDSLNAEIRMSIGEFVQFCTRTFGDNLEDTWVFLDADGSGDITVEEWDTACHEMGYFGPIMPIFRFLDSDNEGTISLDEFKELQQFRVEEAHRTEHHHHQSVLAAPKDLEPRKSQLSACSDSQKSLEASDSRPVSRQSRREVFSDSRRPSAGGSASAPGSRPVSRASARPGSRQRAP